MYLAKMEEEANYFTVTDADASDNDPDICTCQTCIVSTMMSKEPRNNSFIHNLIVASEIKVKEFTIQEITISFTFY